MDRKMQKPATKQPKRTNIRASRRPGVIARPKDSDSTQSQAYTALNKLKRSHNGLSPVEIRLSKILHHKTAADFFALLNVTIGRASGVFGAAAAFLLANLLWPLIYHYYGYEYSYLISVVSLIFGFVLGVLAELAVAIVRKS